MSGDRAHVVLVETLWQYLSAADSRDRTPFTSFLQLRGPGDPSLQTSAMQGFGEEHMGTVARHH